MAKLAGSFLRMPPETLINIRFLYWYLHLSVPLACRDDSSCVEILIQTEANMFLVYMFVCVKETRFHVA
jgi:hypothetical protein